MREFFVDMLCGESGRVSSLRVMTFISLATIIVSWFTLDRDIDGLIIVFGMLLGAVTGGKISHDKFVGKRGPSDAV